MPDRNDVTRRDFARTAVAAAVVPVLAPLASCAPVSRETPPPAPSPDPSAAPVPDDPMLDALTDVLRRQYGERMTDDEMQTVRRGVRSILRTAQRLRDHPLPIEAEPAFVYRVPGKGPR